MPGLEISVVLGYKDWGVWRLVGAVRSLKAALANIESEIIVSDYGSADYIDHKERIEAEGAIFVRTETNGIWSRSRALNAGLQVAEGEILVTTDADMVFTPATFETLLEHFKADSQQYIIMQCNDLPEGISHQDIEDGRYSWDDLTDLSTQRPRWGMGGMIAVPRHAYLASRGLDERMEIYGGEDIDFARRMRRLGLKLSWLTDSRAQMFHVWHPSSRSAAYDSPDGLAAVTRNRKIQTEDQTAARNLRAWEFAPAHIQPLVSVVISTFNRAQYLRLAILSVLAQSFQDFEVLVIDDGSTDETKQVVEKLDDPRIQYHYLENGGLARARNFATSIARGKYIAVMDDDDVMLPSRLEDSLNAIIDGANGSYGGWIDFDDATGTRKFWTGKRLSFGSLLFNNATYLHPTLLIEKKWMEAVPYDETLRSGSDYNMAIRMVRSGVNLRHCGNYVLMRRRHAGQITETDSSIQKSSGAISSYWGRSTLESTNFASIKEDRNAKDKVPIQGQRNVEPRVLEYLPDSAVHRRALIRIDAAGEAPEAVRQVLSKSAPLSRLESIEGRLVSTEVYFEDLSLEDLLLLRSWNGIDIQVETVILDQSAQMTIAEPLRLNIQEQSTPYDALMAQLTRLYSRVRGGMSAAKLILITGSIEDVRAITHSESFSGEQYVWHNLHDEKSIAVMWVAGTVDATEIALEIRDEVLPASTSVGIMITSMAGES